MPQLDKVTFFVQSVSVFISFIGMYYIFIYYLLPDVQLGLRQRELLLKSLVNELHLVRYKFNIHMKLSSHYFISNKELFLEHFSNRKEKKSNQYYSNLKRILSQKVFSEIMGKVLFKLLLLKNVQENNTKLTNY